MTSEIIRKRLGLPIRPFFYTIEQLAGLLSVEEEYIERELLHYKGRSIGAAKRGKLIATNLAPEGQKPKWRVEERDLISYMRFKGINFQQRG